MNGNEIVRLLLASASASVIGFACASDAVEHESVGELALEKAGSDLQGSGACAALAQIDLACPPDLAWDNHGQYVSCVARYLSARVEAGDLDEAQKAALVAAAAQSAQGKPDHARFQGFPDHGERDDEHCQGGQGGAGGDAGSEWAAGGEAGADDASPADAGAGGAADWSAIAGVSCQ